MSVWFDEPAMHGARLRGKPVVSAHLMADSTEELVTFAASIGLVRKWIQHEGDVKEHFDLMGEGKCDLAQQRGAERLDRQEFVRRYRLRRALHRAALDAILVGLKQEAEGRVLIDGAATFMGRELLDNERGIIALAQQRAITLLERIKMEDAWPPAPTPTR